MATSLAAVVGLGNLWDSPFRLAFLDSHSLAAAAAALKFCKTQLLLRYVLWQ